MALRDNRVIRQVPNALTLARLAVVPVFIGLVIANQGTTVLAGVLFMAAAWTDFFDGMIARRLGVMSQFGKIIDPIADRLLVNSGAMLLSYFDPRFPSWAFIVVVWRDLAGIYGMVRLRKHVLVPDVSRIGKVGMFLMMSGIAWLLVLPHHEWPIWFFWPGLALSLVAMAEYVWRYRFTLRAPDVVAGRGSRRVGQDDTDSSEMRADTDAAQLYSDGPAGAGRGDG